MGGLMFDHVAGSCRLIKVYFIRIHSNVMLLMYLVSHLFFRCLDLDFLPAYDIDVLHGTELGSISSLIPTFPYGKRI
jgi:hypothetical protein